METIKLRVSIAIPLNFRPYDNNVFQWPSS